MYEEKKKRSYLPRMICVRQVKGKGQFGVISLCPPVSFGRHGRQAGWSAPLKQVSLDFENLTGNGRTGTVMRRCPL